MFVPVPSHDLDFQRGLFFLFSELRLLFVWLILVELFTIIVRTFLPASPKAEAGLGIAFSVRPYVRPSQQGSTYLV